MNRLIARKLWLIKFCIKVIYPKYNLYTFLVFIAIKFRLSYQRKTKIQIMTEDYELQTLPLHLHKLLLEEYLENNNISTVLLNKCLIISREKFVELCSENLFYIDNGVIWMTIKLAQNTMKICCDSQYKRSEPATLKHNFHLMTCEIHKQLWSDNNVHSNEFSARIVPIVGSKLVHATHVYALENELHNILTSFGLDVSNKNVRFSFHPIPRIQMAPNVAASAEVNLIVNDYDLSNDFLKEILTNHFETPKLLTVNDVFSIDLHPTVTGKYHFKYLDLVEAVGKLYFRCKKLVRNEPPDIIYHTNSMTKGNVQESLFIVKGVTQLHLAENIHVLKPKYEYYNIEHYLKNSSTEKLRLCPTGLINKFEQIQESIIPFINGDMNKLLSSIPNPIIPILLITGQTGSGRHLLTKILAKYNGLNYVPLDCNGLQSSTAKQTEGKIIAMVQKAKAAAPAIVLLDNIEVLAIDPENNEDCRIIEYFTNTMTDLYQNYTKHPLIFIGVTNETDLKPNIARIFLEKFNMTRLNAEQRYEVLEWMVSAMQLRVITPTPTDCSHIEVLRRVAAKTDTFMYGDIDTLMHFALRESYLQQHNILNQLPSDANLHFVTEENFISALENIRSLHSHHLDAPKIPKVYWDDIGGLENLKQELLKTIEFPIKYPHLFKNSTLKRSGILLYGPPGCGKTLVAKAVSTELNVSFLSVKGPELLNMYIGQSEQNVRKVFASARASSPCIVFLDELDALAPRRGAAGDAGGASDRLVSQLLAELDGVALGQDADANSFVFVMGATNRPDLLEHSLLRPGRLDKLVYVGPYEGLQQKTSVLNALCRSYRVCGAGAGAASLAQVAEALPERCTGADLLAVVTAARANAVRTLLADLRAGVVKESELSPESIILRVSDFWHGVETFKPSVTDEQLAYYTCLQTQL